MDITVPPSSCTNSSNCSRSVGVMWALTCAVRFSRLIGQKKKPAPSNKGGRTRAPLGRGKARVGGDSCGATRKALLSAPDSLINVWVNAPKLVLPSRGNLFAPLGNSRPRNTKLFAYRLQASKDCD